MTGLTDDTRFKGCIERNLAVRCLCVEFLYRYFASSLGRRDRS